MLMSGTTKPEITELLNVGTRNASEPCLACYEDTIDSTKCCKAAVCQSCYTEWLKTKRQCMHCKEDQCEFEVWVEHFRIEEDFNPHEHLHAIVAGGDDAIIHQEAIIPKL